MTVGVSRPVDRTFIQVIDPFLLFLPRCEIRNISVAGADNRMNSSSRLVYSDIDEGP